MQFFKSNDEQIDVIFEHDVDIKSRETGQVKHFVAGEQTVTREEYVEYGLQKYRKVNLRFENNIKVNDQIKFEKDRDYSMAKISVRKNDLQKWQWNYLKPECIWDNMFGLPLKVLLRLNCNISFMVNDKVKKLYLACSYFLIHKNDKSQDKTGVLGKVKNKLKSLYPNQADEIEKLSPSENENEIEEKINNQLLFDVQIGNYATWKDMNKVARECENQIYTYIIEQRPELIGLFNGGFLYEKLILDGTDNIFKQNFFAPFESDIADKCEELSFDYVSYFESLIDSVEGNIFESSWRLINEYRESLISVSSAIKNALASFEKLNKQSNKDEPIDKNPDTENMKIEDLTGKTEVSLESLKSELDKLKYLAKNAQESNFHPALQIDLTSIQNKELKDIIAQDLKKLLDNISSVRNIKLSEILDDVLYDFVKFGYKNIFASESEAVQGNAYIFICECINKMSPEYLYQKLFPGKGDKKSNCMMELYNNLYPQKDNGYYVYEGGDLGIDRYLNISRRTHEHFLLFKTVAKKLKYTKERKESFKALARFALNHQLKYRSYHMRYEDGFHDFTSFDPNFIRDNLDDPMIKKCLQDAVFSPSDDNDPYKQIPFLQKIAKYDENFNSGLNEKEYLLKFIELAYYDDEHVGVIDYVDLKFISDNLDNEIIKRRLSNLKETKRLELYKLIYADHLENNNRANDVLKLCEEWEDFYKNVDMKVFADNINEKKFWDFIIDNVSDKAKICELLVCVCDLYRLDKSKETRFFELFRLRIPHRIRIIDFNLEVIEFICQYLRGTICVEKPIFLKNLPPEKIQLLYEYADSHSTEDPAFSNVALMLKNRDYQKSNSSDNINPKLVFDNLKDSEKEKYVERIQSHEKRLELYNYLCEDQKNNGHDRSLDILLLCRCWPKPDCYEKLGIKFFIDNIDKKEFRHFLTCERFSGIAPDQDSEIRRQFYNCICESCKQDKSKVKHWIKLISEWNGRHHDCNWLERPNKFMDYSAITIETLYELIHNSDDNDEETSKALATILNDLDYTASEEDKKNKTDLISQLYKYMYEQYEKDEALCVDLLRLAAKMPYGTVVPELMPAEFVFKYVDHALIPEILSKVDHDNVSDLYKYVNGQVKDKESKKKMILKLMARLEYKFRYSISCYSTFYDCVDHNFIIENLGEPDVKRCLENISNCDWHNGDEKVENLKIKIWNDIWKCYPKDNERQKRQDSCLKLMSIWGIEKWNLSELGLVCNNSGKPIVKDILKATVCNHYYVEHDVYKSIKSLNDVKKREEMTLLIIETWDDYYRYVGMNFICEHLNNNVVQERLACIKDHRYAEEYISEINSLYPNYDDRKQYAELFFKPERHINYSWSKSGPAFTESMKAAYMIEAIDCQFAIESIDNKDIEGLLIQMLRDNNLGNPDEAEAVGKAIRNIVCVIENTKDKNKQLEFYLRLIEIAKEAGGKELKVYEKTSVGFFIDHLDNDEIQKYLTTQVYEILNPLFYYINKETDYKKSLSQVLVLIKKCGMQDLSYLNDNQKENSVFHRLIEHIDEKETLDFIKDCTCMYSGKNFFVTLLTNVLDNDQYDVNFKKEFVRKLINNCGDFLKYCKNEGDNAYKRLVEFVEEKFEGNEQEQLISKLFELDYEEVQSNLSRGFIARNLGQKYIKDLILYRGWPYSKWDGNRLRIKWLLYGIDGLESLDQKIQSFIELVSLDSDFVLQHVEAEFLINHIDDERIKDIIKKNLSAESNCNSNLLSKLYCEIVKTGWDDKRKKELICKLIGYNPERVFAHWGDVLDFFVKNIETDPFANYMNGFIAHVQPDKKLECENVLNEIKKYGKENGWNGESKKQLIFVLIKYNPEFGMYVNPMFLLNNIDSDEIKTLIKRHIISDYEKKKYDKEKSCFIRGKQCFFENLLDYIHFNSTEEQDFVFNTIFEIANSDGENADIALDVIARNLNDKLIRAYIKRNFSLHEQLIKKLLSYCEKTEGYTKFYQLLFLIDPQCDFKNVNTEILKQCIKEDYFKSRIADYINSNVCDDAHLANLVEAIKKCADSPQDYLITVLFPLAPRRVIKYIDVEFLAEHIVRYIDGNIREESPVLKELLKDSGKDIEPDLRKMLATSKYDKNVDFRRNLIELLIETELKAYVSPNINDDSWAKNLVEAVCKKSEEYPYRQIKTISKFLSCNPSCFIKYVDIKFLIDNLEDRGIQSVVKSYLYSKDCSSDYIKVLIEGARSKDYEQTGTNQPLGPNTIALMHIGAWHIIKHIDTKLIIDNIQEFAIRYAVWNVIGRGLYDQDWLKDLMEKLKSNENAKEFVKRLIEACPEACPDKILKYFKSNEDKNVNQVALMNDALKDKSEAKKIEIKIESDGNVKPKVNEQIKNGIDDDINTKKPKDSTETIFKKIQEAINPGMISNETQTTKKKKKKKKNNSHIKNQIQKSNHTNSGEKQPIPQNNAEFPIVDQINNDTAKIMLNVVKQMKNNNGVVHNENCAIQIVLYKNQDCMKKLMDELRSYNNFYNSVCSIDQNLKKQGKNELRKLFNKQLSWFEFFVSIFYQWFIYKEDKLNLTQNINSEQKNILPASLKQENAPDQSKNPNSIQKIK